MNSARSRMKWVRGAEFCSEHVNVQFAFWDFTCVSFFWEGRVFGCENHFCEFLFSFGEIFLQYFYFIYFIFCSGLKKKEP